jgi:hypothetical protein
MAGGVGTVVTGLRSLPRAAGRVVLVGVAFVALVAGLFTVVDVWQGRDVAASSPPAVTPTPIPEPAPPADEQPEEEAPAAEGEPADGAPGGEAAPVPAPTPPPAPVGPAPSSVSIQLLNGIGTDGSAAVTRVRTTLVEAGFRVVASNTGRPYDATTIFYTTGFEAEARLVGSVLGVNRIIAMTELPAERRLSSSVMVHVIIGADRR